MVEEEGKLLARNAKALQELLGDSALQDRYVDDLVQHLQLYK